MNQLAIANLLKWFDENHREMPWRSDPVPYKVWISEIMLQQTQVSAVRPYFERFINRFPDVFSLAAASEQDVLKQWEGLGYYSRARNLLKTAQIVADSLDGQLPESYRELLKLPGLGFYSAAAVASICFREPVPAVDGNVLRVVSRWIEFPENILSQKSRQAIFNYLDQIIPEKRPGDFNQALMELGALICKPSNPLCGDCPVGDFCEANRNKSTQRFPLKVKRSGKPHEQIVVGIVLRKEKVLIARRREGQMLAGLWEFPGGKVEPGESLESALQREMKEEVALTVEPGPCFSVVDHVFTHKIITIHSYLCTNWHGRPKALSASEIRWIGTDEFDKYPFPVANQKIIRALNKVLNGA